MKTQAKICIHGIDAAGRNKVIDIISKALSENYSRNVLVIPEGNITESALSLIPETVDIFVICKESQTPPLTQAEEPPATE